jgi:hypothetical protein
MTGQRVKRRRLDDRMTEGGQAVPAPLVQRDEEHIARRRHATTLADVAHPLPMSRTPEAGRPAMARATDHGRPQEVRILAPPSFVPHSISHAPRRGATARCTARPPVTGIPVTERCIAAGPLVATSPRAARRGPAEAIRSRRWESACDCTALVWIIRSPRSFHFVPNHKSHPTNINSTA